MRRIIFSLVAVVVLSTYSSIVFAQGLPDIPESNNFEKTDEQKHNERIARLLGRPGSGPKLEPRVVTKGLLAPSTQDLVDNQSFLTQPNTGLMRLLPREVVDKKDSMATKELNIRGSGAYYSFFYVAHDYGYGSDLELSRDVLSTGFAGADFGIMTEVGNIPLTDISLDHSMVTFLRQYQPPTNELAARETYQKLHAGFVISGQEYRRSLPLKVGSTYLLRSVVYDYYDTLSAFTVMRKDHDGSAIIAWKRLKIYKKPKLN